MLYVVVEEVIPETQRDKHTDGDPRFHRWFHRHDVTGRGLG